MMAKYFSLSARGLNHQNKMLEITNSLHNCIVNVTFLNSSQIICFIWLHQDVVLLSSCCTAKINISLYLCLTEGFCVLISYLF